MSSNSNSTFSSVSYSSTSSTIDGRTTSFTEERYTDPSGTKIYRTSQQPGEKPRTERVNLPVEGREEKGRIEDVTDKDREYEERMEDEYAKREGGA